MNASSLSSSTKSSGTQSVSDNVESTTDSSRTLSHSISPDINDTPITATPPEATSKITENPFDSPESRSLFEAIDELQSCQINQHIEIPQVRHGVTPSTHPLSIYMFVSSWELMIWLNLASHCRWPVFGQIFPGTEFDGYPATRGFWLLHPLCYPNRVETHRSEHHQPVQDNHCRSRSPNPGFPLHRRGRCTLQDV